MTTFILCRSFCFLKCLITIQILHLSVLNVLGSTSAVVSSFILWSLLFKFVRRYKDSYWSITWQWLQIMEPQIYAKEMDYSIRWSFFEVSVTCLFLLIWSPPNFFINVLSILYVLPWFDYSRRINPYLTLRVLKFC